MKLLAIDGGGMRGVYASHILERIQSEFNAEFHREFDLIAGTSFLRPKRWAFGGTIAPPSEAEREQHG